MLLVILFVIKQFLAEKQDEFLQTGQYFNRNSLLPDNRLSDLAEILPAGLRWQYVTLVKISSQ